MFLELPVELALRFGLLAFLAGLLARLRMTRLVSDLRMTVQSCLRLAASKMV